MMKTEIKNQTGRAPSGVYLSASVTALIASYLAKKRGYHTVSMILQWAVPLLFVGIYSKINKSKKSELI